MLLLALNACATESWLQVKTTKYARAAQTVLILLTLHIL